MHVNSTQIQCQQLTYTLSTSFPMSQPMLVQTYPNHYAITIQGIPKPDRGLRI